MGRLAVLFLSGIVYYSKMIREDEKIQKVLARVGVGSRRQIEGMIVAGRITVNGKKAIIGDRIQLTDQVCLDATMISIKPTAELDQILLYNKPVGEICSTHDPQGRPTVFTKLPKLETGKRWVMIGRLDINSQGLLLFTTCGSYANAMMHPKEKIPRVYKVRAIGKWTKQIQQALTDGVELTDGISAFDSIKLNRTLGQNSWYDIRISSGKNRIIRRLMESQNLTVNRLIRISYGPYTLPKTLMVGTYKCKNLSMP